VEMKNRVTSRLLHQINGTGTLSAAADLNPRSATAKSAMNSQDRTEQDNIVDNAATHP
jgi:hypothetical protein